MKFRQEILLDKAINLLKELLNSDNVRIEIKRSYRRSEDNLLYINLQNKDYYFPIEVKSSLAGNAVLTNLRSRLSDLRTKLLIFEYVSPQIEEFLYHNKISFIDLRGILFLQQNSLFFKVKNNLQPIEAKSYGSAFQPTGIKLLLHLLIQPGLLNTSYREISHTAEVSMGTISNVFKDLKKKGFLYQRNGKKIIRNRQELIEMWVSSYNLKLRPSCFIGKYKSSLDIKNHLPLQTYFSGEVAAELLDLDLKSQIKILYTSLPEIEVIKKIKLIPSDQGDIELLKIFWNQKPFLINGNMTVPLLIVYADLILSDSSRNHEKAGELYEKHLLNFSR